MKPESSRVDSDLPLQFHSCAVDARAIVAPYFESSKAAAAAATNATIVDFLAAVGHAVAAGAGGVVAPAHAARIALCQTERSLRHQGSTETKKQKSGARGNKQEVG